MSENKKSSDYLYLEKLKFNPELRKTWLNFFVSNFRVVILLILIISAWGIYSFRLLPQESNPEVKIPIAVVVTTYPGVSPTDIEELVTKKIEKKVAGLKGIEKITSNSSNSFSTVTVEFDAKENLDDSIRKLKDAVDGVKADLPKDATEPLVKEISFDDTPIISLALSGPFDGLTLRRYSDEIKDELEKIAGVREVNISGGDEREFSIEYDAQKLVFYNVSIDAANQAVKATNLVIPSGTFEGAKYNYPVKVDARFFDVKKLRQIPIYHNEQGAMIYLKDVANVEEKAIERTAYSRLSSGGQPSEEAVTIDIIKKTGGSVLDIKDAVKKTLDERIATYPDGLKYEIVADFAKIIKRDFDQLSHDFLITLVLVFGILFLVVGLKEAVVAGMAIPLVFFATFGVMNLTGISLNFLSLFSLILSLGLLVDDAIVVVSATKQYMRTGKFTPEEAVLLVLNDFKVVLTTTTLTTVWAFLPLLSASGIMGQFLKSIPITVSTTLIASLFIALMINHPLAAVLERIRLTKNFFIFLVGFLATMVVIFVMLKTALGIGIAAVLLVVIGLMMKWYFNGGRKEMPANQVLMEAEWADDELIKKKLRGEEEHAKHGFGRWTHGIFHLDAFLPTYEKYLRLILETKKRSVQFLLAILAVFILAILLPISGILPSEFFPPSDQDYIYVNVTASNGLHIEETDKIVRQAEEKILIHNEILNFSTIVGKPSLNGQTGVVRSSSNAASITINLKDKKERNIKSYDLADIIRAELETIQGAEWSVETPRGGPPSGGAFEARILGEDLQELDKVANELKTDLVAIPGVINAAVSLKEAPADYTFTLIPERLELYNLNAAFVGSSLRMAISGVDVTTVIKDGKEIKVRAIFAKDKLPTLESIQNIQISNLRGAPIFVKDVAKIELKPAVDTISRIDQKRAVLLSAGVSGTTKPGDVLKAFQEKIKNYKMPTGYEIVYGGENESNNESVMSILRAMIIAGLLIVATLIIQFNSVKQAVVVLATIPLALIGVFIGMAVMRVTLSFPGLIGILALFGIVVKNAIILVDKINLNLDSGIPFQEAVVDAGKSRLEAIFITSICTIFGIIPVTLSNETWMALGSAVIFGLMVSSFLTILVVPVAFVLLKEKKYEIS